MQRGGEPIGERIDRARPGARRRRPPGATPAGRDLAGQRRRPLRAQRDQHPAPLDPHFTGVGRCLTDADGRYRVHHRSSPAPTRGATTTTPGGRRTSTSRCSAPTSPSGWSPRCTSRATRCSPLDPIYQSITDPAARERLVATYDHDLTQHEWAHRLPVGHRAHRVTPTAPSSPTPRRRHGGERVPSPGPDDRPVLRLRAALRRRPSLVAPGARARGPCCTASCSTARARRCRTR